MLAVRRGLSPSGSEVGERLGTNERRCAATGAVIIDNLWRGMMAKAAKQRPDNVLTMPSVESPAAMAIASSVREGDIAQRAFELYCDRGREDGHDVDDWLTAERELRDASNSSAA